MTACMYIRDLLSYIFFCFQVSHGSRAATTSQQSSQEERKGTSHKELTSREETTTSTSRLSLQCRYNIGALQHQNHYYDWCTSCDPEDDIKEEENILAICLHLYDVDIKDGECYMLNLPQPRPPTPTFFDGTTPTFPEWARELRAYLSISQFEHIDLLDFAYDAEAPLTASIMVQQTRAGHRQHVTIVRLTQARQDLRDECALPQGDPTSQENAVIDIEIQQITQDLVAQQVVQDAATAGVRQAGELLGYLITQATKPNSEPRNLLR